MKYLLSTFALVLAALPANAQLDLPDKAAKVKPDPGVILPAKPRGDLRPRPAGDVAPGGLDASAPVVAPANGNAPVTEVSGTSLLEDGPTGAIFEHLRSLKSPSDQILEDAALSLASMGTDGLNAARLGLMVKQHGVIVASARTLLLASQPSDRELVRARLDTKISTKTLTALLGLELAANRRDEGNALLVELLGHNRSVLRRVAGKQFRERASEAELDQLLELTSSRHSDTRCLGLELLGLRQGSQVDGALLAALEDRSSTVASTAAGVLAKRITRPGPTPSPEDGLLTALLERARLTGYKDKAGAHALLAVMEAEGLLGVPLLPSSEATSLMIYMRSGSPFVSAAAAAALAGIGFRSDEHRVYLDLEVPHALVSSISGGVYFAEYAVIRPVAARRLSQITGQYFGEDSARWQNWWLNNARDFKALRAVMAVEESQHTTIEVSWYSPAAAVSFRLLGSLVTDIDKDYTGSTLRLVPDKSAELMQALVNSKVFGAERLPGLVGAPTGVEDEFEVRVGSQAKLFRFGAGSDRAWLKPILESLFAFREQAVWQLYPGVQFGLTKEGRASFFQSESSFWSAEHTELERDRRLVNLMFDHASLLAVESRDSVIAEAVTIYNKAGVPNELDFSLLVGLLRDEAFFGERARGILSLTLRSGRSGTVVDGEPMKLSSDLAGEVLDVLVVGSDVMRLEPLAMVLQASTQGFLWAAAEDPRAGIRTVAAAVLANHNDPVSIEHLHRLVADSDKGVEAAAVLAVAAAGMVEFKEEILLRARIGDRFVRLAALRGLANMPGQDTQDVLRLSVLDQDPGLRGAAVESLATLANPSSSALLASMFAGGPTSPLYEASRRGLRSMGEPAWNDLLGIARSQTNNSNRAAALVLSEQNVLDVTTILITMLTDNPRDEELARELAILTCTDYSGEPNAAGAWWGWWDRVDSMDTLVWFCRALGEQDLSIYGSLENLSGEGTLEGGLGLVTIMRGETSAQSFLVERSRREVGRLLGGDIGPFPPRGRHRGAWCDELEVDLQDHYADLQSSRLLEQGREDLKASITTDKLEEMEVEPDSLEQSTGTSLDPATEIVE